MVSNRSAKPIGIIGTGSFGRVIAKLVARHHTILVHTRSEKKEKLLQKEHQGHHNAYFTRDLAHIGQQCDMIIMLVPSQYFRATLQHLSPHLHPYHVIIHGTKGFDMSDSGGKEEGKGGLKTMSMVIEEESCVLRIGCISGPNIAHEIQEDKPAGTIIASKYDEVTQEGQRLLKSGNFLVYGSRDLIGVELCGGLKNMLAIAIGLLDELEMGSNAKALVISRGMIDMVSIGRLLGGNTQTFLSLAGIGDVIGTCFSPYSRNFNVGRRLAKGEDVEAIASSQEGTAEGIRTVGLIVSLAKRHQIRCLVPELLHKIMQKELSVEEASHLITKLPFQFDTRGFFPLDN